MTNAVNIAQLGSNNTTFRNRIINGAMMIAQRGSTENPVTTGYYTVDRLRLGGTASVISSIAPTTAKSTNAPTGFVNSFLWTNTNAASPAITSAQVVILQQSIEGNNIVDLAWGTASAATVTLSFWVRSSLTGTFGGSLANSAVDRSYPFSYTISSANAWEQKTVTIAGDTTGAWLTTNGVGLRVNFSLGAGSTYQATANTWAAGTYYSVTGATNLVATSGATFYITGVQLEKGSTATSFDVRPYTTELQLCQRYYSVGSINNGGGATFKYGTTGATLMFNSAHTFPVEMRDSPTIALGTPTYSNCSSISATFDGTYSNEGFSTRVTVTTSGIYRAVTATWQADAEL